MRQDAEARQLARLKEEEQRQLEARSDREVENRVEAMLHEKFHRGILEGA